MPIEPLIYFCELCRPGEDVSACVPDPGRAGSAKDSPGDPHLQPGYSRHRQVRRLCPQCKQPSYCFYGYIQVLLFKV